MLRRIPKSVKKILFYALVIAFKITKIPMNKKTTNSTSKGIPRVSTTPERSVVTP